MTERSHLEQLRGNAALAPIALELLWAASHAAEPADYLAKVLPILSSVAARHASMVA